MCQNIRCIKTYMCIKKTVLTVSDITPFCQKRNKIEHMKIKVTVTVPP